MRERDEAKLSFLITQPSPMTTYISGWSTMRGAPRCAAQRAQTVGLTWGPVTEGETVPLHLQKGMLRGGGWQLAQGGLRWAATVAKILQSKEKCPHPRNYSSGPGREIDNVDSFSSVAFRSK